MKKKNAIIYARQSSGNDEQSNSVDTQVANCIELCKKNGYNIKLICKDLNISGRTYPLGGANIADADMAFQEWYKQQTRTKKYREQLDIAFAMLEHGDVLVLEDLTRLYRGLHNSYLGTYLKQQLASLQITVATVKNGSFDPRSFNDELIESIQSHVNDQQIQIGKKKSMEVKNRLRDSGILCSGFRTLGLTYLGDHKYKIDEKYREAIKYVYDNILGMMTYSKIQRDMNNKYGFLFGKRFYESNFYHIAEQPLYAGYMRNTNNEIIKCKGFTGEPIISIDDWYKVQNLMEEKRLNPVRGIRKGNILPFSRKCVCGFCKSKMVVIKDKKSVAYFCRGGAVLENEQSCSKSRIRINETKSSNYTGLQHALTPLLVLAQYQDCLEYAGYAKTKEKYKQLRNKMNAMRERMQNITATYMRGDFDAKLYESTNLTYNKERSKMETELCLIQANMTTDYKKNMLNDPFWGMFEKIMSGDIDDAKYKELFDKVIDEIICYENHITIVTKFGNFDLERYADKKSRSFPNYSWVILTDNTDKPKDITKCQLEITYHYNDNREKKIKVDFPVLSIYESK